MKSENILTILGIIGIALALLTFILLIICNPANAQTRDTLLTFISVDDLQRQIAEIEKCWDDSVESNAGMCYVDSTGTVIIHNFMIPVTICREILWAITIPDNLGKHSYIEIDLPVIDTTEEWGTYTVYGNVYVRIKEVTQ